MTGRLEGKIALITGVGGGMGVAAARRFAAEGARVVGCDLDRDGAAATEELVRAEGGEITVMGGVDLGDADAARGVGGRRGGDVRRHRRALQQRLDPAVRRARRAEHRGLGLHDAQRARPRLLHGARRLAAPQGVRRRLDHQRRLDRGDPRRGVHAAERALDRQGRRHRADPAAGRRGRPARHPRQRDQPRPDRDPEHRADAGRPARADEARSSSTGSRSAGTDSPRTSSTPRSSWPPTSRRGSAAPTSSSTAAAPCWADVDHDLRPGWARARTRDGGPARGRPGRVRRARAPLPDRSGHPAGAGRRAGRLRAAPAARAAAAGGRAPALPARAALLGEPDHLAARDPQQPAGRRPHQHRRSSSPPPPRSPRPRTRSAWHGGRPGCSAPRWPRPTRPPSASWPATCRVAR